MPQETCLPPTSLSLRVAYPTISIPRTHLLHANVLEAVAAYAPSLGMHPEDERALLVRIGELLPPPPPEKIVSAAVRIGDGQVFFCTPRAGHAEIRKLLEDRAAAGLMPQGFDMRFYVDDGFLTSMGRFVLRAEGFRIAFRADQPRKPRPAGEDLLLEDILAAA